jgi:predicted dehydrogenase
MNIIIFGAGGMGEKHIKAISNIPDCRVHIFDVNEARLSLIFDRYKLCTAYADLEKIPRNFFHGAIIASPASTHLTHAKWCLNEKITFLVEKPIALELSGLEELAFSCRKEGVQAGVAYPRRYGGAYLLMRNMIDSGAIGNIKIIRTNFSQDFRKYRPDYSETYYAKLASGGGILMDALSHHINLASYFGGEIKRVMALTDNVLIKDAEGEDTSFLTVIFKNGILGSIYGNQFQKPNTDFLEIVGEKGNLSYERRSGLLKLANTDDVKADERYIDGDWDLILQSQAIEFINVIKTNEPFKTNLEDGIRDLKVILAARKSNIFGGLLAEV